MYITDIYYQPSQKTVLKNDIFKLYLKQSVFNTSMMIYKILISPKCHIVNDFNSYFILIINKYSNWII